MKTISIFFENENKKKHLKAICFLLKFSTCFFPLNRCRHKRPLHVEQQTQSSRPIAAEIN